MSLDRYAEIGFVRAFSAIIDLDQGEAIRFLYIVLIVIFSYTMETFAKEGLISPVIQGDTLYISGTIQSHIYDYMSYEAKALQSVRYVDLDSDGGDYFWGLNIAKKVKSMGLITQVSKQSYCASSCIFILSAGSERLVHEEAKLMVHGVQAGTMWLAQVFLKTCFVRDKQKPMQYNFLWNDSDCDQLVAEKAESLKEKTEIAFDFMESSGVLPSLREDYYGLPGDDQWIARGNLLKIPDMELTVEAARHYNLVTDILRP